VANKVGRPKSEFNLKQVEIFGKFKATYETMAEYFSCSVDTIRRRMQDENSEFSKVYKKAFANTKLKLSEAQLYYALKGNATLLIWTGKQLLGQRDNAYAVADDDNTDNKLKFEGWDD